MFSTRLSRAAQRATCVVNNTTSTAAATAAAAHRSSQGLTSRRSHQRRQSSSKASCPPDSSPSGGKPAPAAKAAEPAEDTTPSLAENGSKRVARTKRQRTPVTAYKAGEQFAGLPAVPGTQHLRDSDLAVSSFFSLHRPLSLSTTIPPSTTNDAFESIFETRKDTDPWENGNSAERRPEDVVYALGSLFENFDIGTSESQDDNVRWEVVSENQSSRDGIKHIDGLPRQKSLDELIAEFEPFKAPPAPQPFPAEHKASEKKTKAASKSRQKSYQTSITVTEYTRPNGQKIYTASSTPIVRIDDVVEQPAAVEPTPETNRTRFPHRERMQERERASNLRMQDERSTKRNKMMLISVKRQRKLKMKKHKYKKLMRRTRNLRRRQDRA